MYVLGGHDGAPMASVLKFDSTQGTWSQVVPMPADRYAHAACAIGSDIYVFGGNGESSQPQASVFKFDTPHECSWHSASLLGGLIYIVGAGDDHCETLRFDPASGAWSTLAPTLVSREDSTSFVLDECLYVADGNDGSEKVERYDVASDTWTAVANMLQGRFFSVVAFGSAGPAEEEDLFDSLIAKASSGRL
jgi:hypothetical protein